MSLLAGLLILLRSAARITHKAQGVTCLAAKWHVCATIDSFDGGDGETPVAKVGDEQQAFLENSNGSFDYDDVGDEEDELDNTKFIPAYAYSTISFQKRQALGEFFSLCYIYTYPPRNEKEVIVSKFCMVAVTYFENNRAGITVFGFMLDRSSLHTIFGIELSLVLWLLGKTVGIS